MSDKPLTARQITVKYWDGNLPVNLESICRALSIQLIADHNRPTAMLVAHSGRYIHYDPTGIPMRVRWSVAHAIYHHLHNVPCEGDIFQEPEDAYSSSTKSFYCKRANQFALDLLVPEEAFDFVLRRKEGRTVEAISETFCISEIAVGVLIKERLGY